MKKSVYESTITTNSWGDKEHVLIMKWSHRVTLLGTSFSVEETFTKAISELGELSDPESLDVQMTERLKEKVHNLKLYLDKLEKIGFNE